MSIRTSATLDDDLAACIERESQSRGRSCRDTLNDLLRAAMSGVGHKPRTLVIKPARMGYKPGLDYASIESLLKYGE